VNIIGSNPKIRGGNPVINGTWLSFDFLLNLLSSGTSEKETLEN